LFRYSDLSQVWIVAELFGDDTGLFRCHWGFPLLDDHIGFAIRSCEVYGLGQPKAKTEIFVTSWGRGTQAMPFPVYLRLRVGGVTGSDLATRVQGHSPIPPQSLESVVH
jgi:hypothetical protein